MKRNKKILAAVLCMAVTAVLVWPIRAAAAGNVSIEGVGQEDTVTYEAGEKKSLIIKVTNSTGQPVQNVVIAPDKENAPDGWPFAAIDEPQKLASLAPGESKKIPFYAEAGKDAEVKTYRVNFKVSFDGGDATDQIILVSVKKTDKVQDNTSPNPTPDTNPAVPKGPSDDGGGISGYSALDGGGGGSVANADPVSSGGGSSTASVPRVIVSGFTTEPAEVKAGSNFKLIIHIQNTSKKTAVNNMLFDLSTPTEGGEGTVSAPAFLPSSGSSSIYLDRIPAGGTKDIAIDLNARADLIQKPYSIQLSMKYEDGSANQFEAASAVSIPIKQDARFEFSEFELSPTELPVGEEGNVTCSLYNLGRTKLYNVKAKFEGEGIKAKDLFLGNVESGATASVDGMLAGEKETSGDGTVKMILSYEDEAGTISTVEKTFILPVVAQQDAAADMGAVSMEVEKKFPIVPVIVGAAAVAAIAGGIIFYKVRKKKKAKAEEEDLEDELDRLIENE